MGLKVDTAIRFVQTVHQHFLDLILFLVRALSVLLQQGHIHTLQTVTIIIIIINDETQVIKSPAAIWIVIQDKN